jgi:hypothetical protein
MCTGHPPEQVLLARLVTQLEERIPGVDEHRVLQVQTVFFRRDAVTLGTGEIKS